MSSKQDQDYALGQFASHISIFSASTIIKNDFAESSSPSTASNAPTATKEEAQLLMNLLSPVPHNRRSNVCNLRDAFSPPGSIDCYKNSVTDGVDCFQGTIFRRFDKLDSDPFSFTCPSLSLASNHFIKTNRNLHQHRAVSPNTDHYCSNENNASKNVVSPLHGKKQTKQSQQPNLGELLDRQLSENNTWGHVDVLAERLTENIRGTFEYVVDSRMQTWMASLNKVIQLRGGEEAHAASCNNSKEAKVLQSLSKVCTKLTISKVSTTFRSLREESSSSYHQDNHHAVPEINSCTDKQHSRIVTPLPKKKFRKMERHVSEEDENYDPTVMRRPLEFTVTMDISPYNLTLFLHAPGYITGIFDDDSSELTGIDITLDMDKLVDSIRKQSRYVARKAAEAELKNAASTVTSNTESEADTDVATNTVQQQQQNNKRHAKECTSRNNSTNTAMPPPPPRLVRNNNLRPGIVSPSPGSPSGISYNSPSHSRSFPPSLQVKNIAQFVSPTLKSSSSNNNSCYSSSRTGCGGVPPPRIDNIMGGSSTDHTEDENSSAPSLPALVSFAVKNNVKSTANA